MRRGKVYVKSRFAGIIGESDAGYYFSYDQAYLGLPDAEPVSVTLPLRNEPYESKTMIPFFDGLIPEGWLLSITARNWKLDEKDRMGLLLTVCRDCIGAVRVEGGNA
ncbi:MAG: phosphatidylinositol kinase [Candidatus Raymondbacteria bacterium RifOxyA12_full_50_37]|uniref:Phosphatidylinositol kinase n=1 Tax=Candidatus Raymondbacteria bacterium RIFOXYD12_FULL_49_13 TaxID=1817890 RepID=A0A1F7F2J3_UNCRA|nr:MAG: phosphatidylinositol kinase [Candidatus Raymondbacteria bacterium RifOxyA12_full_50_37]OGJ85925.1 MAG: phosphatidylinositol kinase [Candidatus Raymondbacteria bacterium RIFOXYA2_FULL_49_16]OGJ95919.1 MAG: phosphatidylinositol kinase [Candidatus Raymondbacteria bacterium RIFOXYC2_FULL_50_21]OGK00783.1 MAG: phosphatidylinositol kinase [Candidatus Raymondbacteria bacterium RIFOXYD12_FULL_49_13]OGK00792.1 MAG: phosphatidylinositol kinase [Candidatus Raymondbacteria bacterium RifOxyB12_full_